MHGFTNRVATEADIPAITDLMTRSIAELQRDFLSPAQIAASRAVMGLDTQLIADRTYLLVEDGARIAGCGGWSRRRTLYGGDHSTALRDATLLDPLVDAARIRAMYTDPDYARRGVGRTVLALCEDAAAAAGFAGAELMATLSGVPLYRACGYTEVQHIRSAPIDGVAVALIRMAKSF